MPILNEEVRSQGANWAHRMLDSAAAVGDPLPGSKPLIEFLRKQLGDPFPGRRLGFTGGRAAVLLLVSAKSPASAKATAWSTILAQLGVTSKVSSLERLEPSRLLADHAAFVVVGTFQDPAVDAFVQQARDAERIVILDTAPLALATDVLPRILREASVERPSRRSLAINWVVRAPVAARSGTFQSVFRIANELGRRGHRVRVYIDPAEHLSRLSTGEILDYVEKSFGPLSVEPIIGLRAFDPSDVAIGTCWRSAEFVARDRAALFHFRLFQELEENRYSPRHRYYYRTNRAYGLPVQGIALGRMLAPRIRERSGSEVDAIDLAVDQETFSVQVDPAQRGPIPRILFYARPDLPARGYGIGVAALREVAKKIPEAEISFFGALEEDLGQLPFAARCLGVPSREQLAAEMNRAHVVLSLSLAQTVSGVSLQAMSCGATVVESTTSGLSEILPRESGFELASPDPATIAETVESLLRDDTRCQNLARAGVRALQKRDWPTSIDQFESILFERCFAATECIQRPTHLLAVAR